MGLALGYNVMTPPIRGLGVEGGVRGGCQVCPHTL